MSLTDQIDFQAGFLHGYLAGDQTIGGTTPVVNDCPGPAGDIGPAGPDSTVTGLDGDPGAVGAQGPIGDTGDKGPTGDAGRAGIDGEQGVTGIKGPTGDRGIQGVKGDTGIQGPTGLAQRLLTDIQIYNDGFIATYSDSHISNCAWNKDASSRITLWTDLSITPHEVTTIGYNAGNRP